MQVSIRQAAPIVSAILELGNLPPFVLGDPGIGKSDMVRQIAAQPHAWATALGHPAGVPLPVIDVRAVLLDAVDVKGMPVPDMAEQKMKWLIANIWPDVSRDGPCGILFFDELTNGAAMVQSALLQLVLDKCIGDYVLPTGWKIIAAGNRATTGAGAGKLITSLRNRFVWVDMVHDVDACVEYWNARGINPIVPAFIRFRHELLHKMPKGEQNAFPTPRSWSEAALYAKAPDGMRMHLIAGCVGDEAAAEFEAFVRTWQALPSPESILSNPAGAVVPTEPSALYAVSSMVSRIATKSNMQAIVTYAARFATREFEIVAVVDAVRRDPSLCETAAFAQWAAKHSDVQI